MCGFLRLFVCFYKPWNIGKLPEDGRGSKLRKGHGDNIISWEVKAHISFEENNGKSVQSLQSKG